VCCSIASDHCPLCNTSQVLPIAQLPDELQQQQSLAQQQAAAAAAAAEAAGGPSYPRVGRWQDVRYKGDWMRRPIGSSEIGVLVGGCSGAGRGGAGAAKNGGGCWRRCWGCWCGTGPAARVGPAKVSARPRRLPYLCRCGCWCGCRTR
jgi:hypothetical protein